MKNKEVASDADRSAEGEACPGYSDGPHDAMGPGGSCAGCAELGEAGLMTDVELWRINGAAYTAELQRDPAPDCNFGARSQLAGLRAVEAEARRRAHAENESVGRVFGNVAANLGERIATLEIQISNLMDDNARLRHELATLESELSAARAMLGVYLGPR